MQEPKLLIEIKEDFDKNPENFNPRKWYRALSDSELVKFLNEKYPNIKSITEKLYLYLHKMEDKPQGLKFKPTDFKYYTPEEFKKVTPTSQIDTIESTSIWENMLTSGFSDMMLTFYEKEFLNNVSQGDIIYFAQTFHSSGQILACFYNISKELIYICLLPSNVKLQSLKEKFESDFKATLDIYKFPFDLYTQIFNERLLNSPSLAPMSYVMNQKYKLY